MRIPKYRKHSSGQGRVTIGGRDFLLGPFGSKESKRKYNRLIAEWISSEQSPQFGEPKTELTVVNVLAAYHRFAKTYYGIGKEVTALEMAMRPLRKLYGPEPASSIGPVQWKAIRQTWLTKDCSRQYANKQTNRLMRVFKWAAAERMIPTEVYQTLKLVEPLKKGRCNAREADPIKPVGDEIVEITIAKLSPIVADMVRIQRLTGCRPGEVCSFTPGMIDRSGDVWKIHLDKHKTAWRGKQRVVLCGPKAQAILLNYMLRGDDEYCFSPAESEKKRREAAHELRTTPLNEGNRPGSKSQARKKANVKRRKQPGLCYTSSSYRKAIEYACDKAFPPPKDLPELAIPKWRCDHRWSPNRLRHNLATQVRKSDGLEVTSIILGHSEVGVTQVYAEADEAKAIEVVRRIG